MSQPLTMDPDIPAPSIEHNDSASSITPNTFTNFRDNSRSPRVSSSPNRIPFKTPLSHPQTPSALRSSDSPSNIRNERRSTPNLQPPRSSSSLSVSRGQTPSRIQLRRVSSNLNPASPTANMNLPDSQLPPQLTADSVAKEYFERELQTHNESQSKTMVIVHDSCYGHRFSRPRTSKAALSTIVERPERIHATLLGASTAYVRLGERHSDGAYGPHPGRNVKTLPNPPFLLKKTTRTIPLDHPAVTQVHGSRWMEELQIMCDSAESKLAMNGKELSRPIGYGKDEEGNSLPKLHEGDLYLCSETLAALQGCLGGVCEAVDAVFSDSETERAFVCIRPPGHHCSSNYPSGFCWLNNVHIGISYAAINHGLTHAAIIDFDLHHGDGSQTITWDHNSKAQSLPKNAAQHKKTPVGYYSLHDINSYPCEWGDDEKVRNASLCIENAHGQSVWNVHLEPWTSLEHFWQLYQARYITLLEKAKSFLRHHSDRLRSSNIEPKAAIFLSAGFDASQWEGQGMQRHNVNVPTEFYAKFTSDVVQLAADPDLGVSGRVISVLEGGYSDRALTSGVLSHLCGLSHEAAEHSMHGNNSASVSNGLGPASVLGQDVQSYPSFPYDSQWWHESNLEALESRVAGNLPPLPKKKDKAPGTYSSPTHASTARMTEVARERNSLSAQLERRLWLETADPGPPPAVDWVTASYTLSRILIPGDRQTLSCRHDELNAEATKIRRDRQSAIGVAVPEPRMQLRARAKGPVNEPDAIHATSRTSNRRTTIAAVSELPDPSMSLQRPRRRSSAASSILSSFQDMKLDDSAGLSTETADSAQPDSTALSSAKELAVKRSKMPPPAKKTTTRISSPRKMRTSMQPVPKTTSLQDMLGKAKAPPYASASRSPSRSRRSSRGDVADTDVMKDLTQGLKKVSIKLNMPTPEQHAENQRKAEDAKLKKARVVRKPPVPKPFKAKAGSVQAPADAVKSEVLVGEVEETGGVKTSTDSTMVSRSFDNPTMDRHTDVLNGSEQNNHTAVAEDPTQISESIIPTNIHNGDSAQPHQEDFHPEPLPDTITMADSSILANGLENGISNTSKRTRADLPVFTSSSPIPFAREQSSSRQEEAKVEQVASIWDVPDTPRH